MEHKETIKLRGIDFEVTFNYTKKSIDFLDEFVSIIHKETDFLDFLNDDLAEIEELLIEKHIQNKEL